MLAIYVLDREMVAEKEGFAVQGVIRQLALHVHD